tara:strand:+ start:282 stop:806 length:525 start_codon:yes stop_codon:yes gene_type:complete
MNNQQILFLGSFITVLVVAILFWPSTDAQQSQTTAETSMESISSVMQAPEGAILVTMYKNEGCMCCTRWAEHMNKEGFFVTEKVTRELGAIKSEQGISNELASCHTAMIDGYIVEGHVPPADVQRLLKERPDAIGLSVPGMPEGSPGMEGPNPDPYDVLLINSDGSTSVYSSYR